MTNSPRQRQHDNTSGTTQQQSTHPMTTGLRTRYEIHKQCRSHPIIANHPYCCATKKCVAYSLAPGCDCTHDAIHLSKRLPTTVVLCKTRGLVVVRCLNVGIHANLRVMYREAMRGGEVSAHLSCEQDGTMRMVRQV